MLVLCELHSIFVYTTAVHYGCHYNILFMAGVSYVIRHIIVDMASNLCVFGTQPVLYALFYIILSLTSFFA